jgi:anti-sigma B factor antagonist
LKGDDMTDQGTGATVIALKGEFDLAQRERVQEVFSAALGEPLVIVDMSGTTYADSTVLSALLKLNTDLQARGGKLILVGPSAMVQRILAVTGLGTVFEVRATLAEVASEHKLTAAFRRIELRSE